MPGKYDVPYMQRTLDYYRAQGYHKDYEWAYHNEAPFTPLPKPLRECRVGLITTAMPDTLEGRTKRQVVASMSTPTPHSMYTDELSWHKTVTHTNDLGSFLPLNQLRTMARSQIIDSLSGRFYSAPTEYSQRNTRENDAPAILELCREDHVDVAMLVPLWPVCHQTVSLVSRHLEENGIPTVIIGSALDVVEHCGVARYLHIDFPLGNPCGIPGDPFSQIGIARRALTLLEEADGPETTWRSSLSWRGGDEWRDDYSKVDDSNREELRQLGERRRQQQLAAKESGDKRAPMISDA